MDKRFFWESWRLANRSSEYIRWALTGIVIVYFLHKDYALMNSWCFELDMVLTCIGFIMVVVLIIKQHEMLKVDEQYYKKAVERAEKQDAKKQSCMVVVLNIKQHELLEVDEQYYKKAVERAEKQDAEEQGWQEDWHKIDREMRGIEEKNGKNLNCLKILLSVVYIIAGISVIIAPICIH